MNSNSIPIYRAAPEAEVIRGALPYLEVLRHLHASLQPEVYLEIGVRHGRSLALAHGSTVVGVDPAPELRAELAPQAQVVAMTSDEFFASPACASHLYRPVDLAFIDGMHLFEFVLRDFMQVERRSSRAGVIVLDDIFPNHPLQARRVRESSVWTGDVWKILHCLRRYRPDLKLLALDTNPTGLLLVANLDPNNDGLRHRYAEIVDTFAGDREPPAEILARHGAVVPTDGALRDFIRSSP